MTKDEIIQLAQEAGFWVDSNGILNGGDDDAGLLVFADLVVEAEREKVAQWMIEKGYATGHGDTIEDLLKELEWQITERMKSEGWRQCAAGQRTTQYCDLLELAVANEREACAKLCEDGPIPKDSTTLTHIPTLVGCAAAIRARGNE
jgi:hypothetical protein